MLLLHCYAKYGVDLENVSTVYPLKNRSYVSVGGILVQVPVIQVHVLNFDTRPGTQPGTQPVQV